MWHSIQMVEATFQRLSDELNNSTQPFHVLLDIKPNAIFPLVETLAKIVQLSYHHNLDGWCIVGEGQRINSIVEVLQRMDYPKVYRFDTIEAVMQYLDAH